MCGQTTRCGGRNRMTRQAQPVGCGCCGTPCICNCGNENVAPTATISMADYQPFIMVPTTVFDSGDEDCGCGVDW